MIAQEIGKLKRQTRLLNVATYSAIAAILIVGGVWLGFDKGQAVQARADIAQVRAWVAHADYPTVYLVYPGKLPVAEIRDGACLPNPKTLPLFYNRVYVSPRYIPCATQHYTKPTTPSPALAMIEEHVK